MNQMNRLAAPQTAVTVMGAVVALIVAISAQAEFPIRSTCYGTPEEGRLENDVALPSSDQTSKPTASLV